MPQLGDEPLFRCARVHVFLMSENTHTAQTSLVFLYLQFLSQHFVLAKSFGFGLQPSGVRSLLYAPLILDAVGTVLSPCVLRRQYSEENHCVSIPHSYTARIKHSVVFCGYRRHELFTRCEPKYNFDESKNVLMRSGQATPIPLGGNLSESMMINSLPALPTPSDDLYDTMEIMNPRTVHVESARKRDLYAVAL